TTAAPRSRTPPRHPCLLRSALLPYTTLFRSHSWFSAAAQFFQTSFHFSARQPSGGQNCIGFALQSLIKANPEVNDGRIRRFQIRSEEHTSKLQSRENLVCRLLLEKKKKNNGR